jgi:hypothetical protein
MSALPDRSDFGSFCEDLRAPVPAGDLAALEAGARGADRCLCSRRPVCLAPVTFANENPELRKTRDPVAPCHRLRKTARIR